MSGETLEFNVKHSGNVYPISITSSTTVQELKEQVQELTNVPVSRQKFMVKGGFTDNSMSNLGSVIKQNANVMMLGTPDADLVSKPKKKSTFIEDLLPGQQFQQFNQTPIGLKNLGNTCYLNATLQCLFRIEPLREMILNYKQSSSVSPADEVHQKIVLELRNCFDSLDKKKFQAVMPLMLLNVLRKAYPQFAERDPQGGFYKQQDAEELFTQLFHSLSVILGDKFSDLFTIRYRTTIKDINNEEDVTVKEDENDLKLQCHISGTTNFLKSGLEESLKEQIEKRSDISGVNSTFVVQKQITKLPRFLTVQNVRFFWKRSTQKKSKILRKVTFPFQLDVADMLTPDYASDKIKVREELRLVEKEKSEKERELKKRKLNNNGVLDVLDNEGDTIMTPRERQETEEALKQSEDEHWAEEFKKHFPKDLEAGENPSSVYNLIGIITHQGANSESGHYQAFIRDREDEEIWYKFNDDKVTIVDKEKIETLAGGGESDSALILLYKGLGL
ncbi:hypothetical protein TBLA_0C01200 [Henningerozyma blattae CBS 6284]|uniref:Ubiquitin carboxyl-terminal hydrolase n=1 Tax=Henningerozyma blattae (strain ATCC 34711 / CBS 6284 / DSM 70876 / NBRC 10599 / NRRL Y-10934 / UCD 77-7) TaxID=1071380 RepID=I2H0N3_HENB6|nr:hypothetical protein TBLA_0C01200 [Tetrapisispora blattae CBS 6284]CCH59935.1 hypothetical protein TBLA_0C01200 [Tetrapisispora blattae CBS 6284]